jgi:hypothetical protein
MSAVPFCHCVCRTGSSKRNDWLVSTWVESREGSIRFQGRRFASVHEVVFPSEALADREKAKRNLKGAVVS